MIRIFHVITDLDLGGAEVMLTRLLETLDRDQFKLTVVSLKKRGVITERIEALGIPVYHLNMNAPLKWCDGILTFRRLLQQKSPDLIQGWMYHGNVASFLLKALFAKKTKVLWNIRHSLHILREQPVVLRFLIRLGAFLSKSCHGIIYNAGISAKQHAAMGYSPQKEIVIPNGFDLERFRPDPRARKKVRGDLNVPEKTILIGLIARFDPLKDHVNFLKAAALLVREKEDVYFLMVGRGVDQKESGLLKWIERLGLKGRVMCLGERHDVAPYYAALDIMALTSRAEAFPNAVGEAMSSGVPCVVTDVGDCRYLVGNTGIVVPPRNPEALKAGLEKLIEMGHVKRGLLGEAARNRIREKFSISSIVKQYETLYQGLVNYGT